MNSRCIGGWKFIRCRRPYAFRHLASGLNDEPLESDPLVSVYDCGCSFLVLQRRWPRDSERVLFQDLSHNRRISQQTTRQSAPKRVYDREHATTCPTPKQAQLFLTHNMSNATIIHLIELFNSGKNNNELET